MYHVIGLKSNSSNVWVRTFDVLTAPFNNMRTLKFKNTRQMRFLPPSIKCSAAAPNFRLRCLNCAQRFDLITARSALVGSWEELLTDRSEKRVCQLTFEFYSLCVIESRSKTNICPRSEASGANVLVLRTSNFLRGDYQTDSSQT